MLPAAQAGGFIGGLAALGAGLWAANEYGYINLSKATGVPIPQLTVGKRFTMNIVRWPLCDMFVATSVWVI